MFLFWICTSVVMSCVYSLSKYFWGLFWRSDQLWYVLGWLAMLVLMRFSKGEMLGWPW